MTEKNKGFSIDLETIRQLANVLAESALTEIEYAEGDCRIRVARTMTAPATPIAAAVGPAPLADKDGMPRTEADAFADHPGLLTSPMVGIVYTSAEPGAPSFVQIGDRVAIGDTVLLIEAMKVFNPIKAHRAGSVERIFVKSGMPVEYGEPLLVIV